MKRNLTTREAAQLLQDRGIRVTSGTLNVWRSQGRGPRFKKIGRHVYYTREALDQFERGEPYETIDSLEA